MEANKSVFKPAIKSYYFNIGNNFSAFVVSSIGQNIFFTVLEYAMRSYTSFCYICLSFNEIISPDSENKILIDQGKERMTIGEYFYAHLFVLFAISCKPTDSSSEV